MNAEANRMRWDMDAIFPGGSSSKEFDRFREAIAGDLKKAEAVLAGLPRSLTDDTAEAWIKFLLMIQDLEQRLDHAISFAFCLTAQDVNDDRAMIAVEELTSKEANLEVIKTGIEEFAIAVEDDAWNKLLSDKRVSGMAFYWNEKRRNARLKMEPMLEKLATELAVSGYHAWNRLYTKMAGDLRAEFTEAGKTKASRWASWQTR